MIRAILNNSTILLNLPPETIGELLQRLPTNLIIEVVNSEGVKNLFHSTASHLDEDELKKAEKFQSDIAVVLVEKLDIRYFG